MQNVNIFLWFLLWILATEGTVEVLLKGKIFDGIRERVYSVIRPGSFIGELIRCPYCLSFWVSAGLLVAYALNPTYCFWYCVWLSVCRSSNFLNNVYDKIFYGQYGNLTDKGQ